MSATASRQLASQVLLRVERDAAFAERALGAALGRCNLPGRERALVTELVYGTLRHAGWLDSRLAPLLTRPLRQLPPPVLAALRLGAYQLLLTRVPAHSAVSESVHLVRPYGRLAGVVNAVLRRLAAQAAEGTPPTAPRADANAPATAADDAATAADADTQPSASDAAGAEVEALAVASSHPLALVREVAARRGVEAAAAWLRANNAAPPVALRANLGRIAPAALVAALRAAGLDAEAVHWSAPWAADSPSVRVRRAGAVRALPGFDAGHFSVQDPAATLVGLLARPRPGSLVLDLCAAPGGKATHLAELLGGDGTVLAVDVHPGRLRLVEAQALRLGLLGLRCVRADGRDSAALADACRAAGAADGAADLVLVDAPCSGLGTLRRHPERRRRPPDAARMADLVRLQAELLDAAAARLRPGGVLVYAVCTVTHAEGEAQIEALLRRHPQLALEAPAADGPNDRLAPGGLLRTWTDQHDSDSFFAARLRRH